MHWSKTAALRGIVFVEGDILDPMQAILNLPMLAGSLEQLCGSPRSTTEVVNRFGKGLTVALTRALHDSDGRERVPLGLE